MSVFRYWRCQVFFYLGVEYVFYLRFVGYFIFLRFIFGEIRSNGFNISIQYARVRQLGSQLVVLQDFEYEFSVDLGLGQKVDWVLGYYRYRKFVSRENIVEELQYYRGFLKDMFYCIRNLSFLGSRREIFKGFV